MQGMGKIHGVLHAHLAHLGVSKNCGTPKSSILIGFSIINHPFWGTPIFGNTHLSKDGNISSQDGISFVASALYLSLWPGVIFNKISYGSTELAGP